MKMAITPARRLVGEIRVPGDKSISHRAVMLGSIAQGDTYITNFLMSDDCMSTIRAFQHMGVPIQITDRSQSRYPRP